jgi:protein involved in polysaccharide export with SLBB domain
MKFLLKRLNHLFLLIGMLGATVLLSGCDTFSGGHSGNTAGVPQNDSKIEDVSPLRVDDAIIVTFSGVTSAPEKFDGRVKEDGTISLALIGNVEVKGLTPGQLEKAIREKYLEAKLFKNTLNVTVNAESRSFSISGEVRNPSRQVHSGKMTILSAIASAGGFTDFANKKKVQIIRVNGSSEFVNCTKALKNATLDVPIFPGDRIIVPRRVY